MIHYSYGNKYKIPYTSLVQIMMCVYIVCMSIRSAFPRAVRLIGGSSVEAREKPSFISTAPSQSTEYKKNSSKLDLLNIYKNVYTCICIIMYTYT